MDNPILLTTYRNNAVENVHRGTFVLFIDGQIVRAAGNHERSIYPRSSLKSIQAMACVLSGAVEQFGITPRELAVICGSHWAEPQHVDAVGSILSKADVPESALQCGTHPLENRDRQIELALAGETLTPIHHNCSGKHAGMLTAAKAMGAPLENYLDLEHPVQQRILKVLSELSGCSADHIGCGVDGCAAPAFRLPLAGVARTFAQMSTPVAIEQHDLRDAARKILTACLEHPQMVSGEKGFCTALMRAGGGRIFAKGGAEAYYAFGLVGKNTGFAMKLDDGEKQYHHCQFVVHVAKHLGGVGEVDKEHVSRYDPVVITNCKNEVVGGVEVVPFEEFS